MAYSTACDASGKELEFREFAIDIQLAMEPERWPECCIYKVPKRLREVNGEAYTPKIVSIGPLHYGRECLKSMERQKVRYLREFCFRTGNTQAGLRSIIAEEEINIRRCYSETFELSSEEFMNMILLDAIFIIYVLWRNWERRKDNISHLTWLEISIKKDLMLLENQLPFFVLEKLYEAGPQIEEKNRDQNKRPTFLKVCSDYFPMQWPEPETKEVKHLVDWLRKRFVTQDLKDEPNSKDKIQYSATKLKDAGLTFKVTEARPLLGIQLNNWCFNCSCLLACIPCLKCFPCLEGVRRVLEVPKFEIDDSTEVFFRNLMALEQCHYPFETHICNYLLLLDCLIDTKADVDLLVEKKIIVNLLGSNEDVAKLINKLGLEILPSPSCFSKLSHDLNKHYEQRLNQALATLKGVYFPDIWRGTGTVIGVFVLGITLWNFLKPFIL